MRTTFVCLALVFVLFCPFASAQWVQTNLPDSLTVSCFAVSGTNLFAGTAAGVFLSSTGGSNWAPFTSGLTSSYIYSLAVQGTDLFAGTSGDGVFRSTDRGATWTHTYLTTGYVYCLALSETNLIAGTGGGAYLSTDRGASWTAPDPGLSGTPNAFLVYGKNLFAGTGGGGIFLSTNNGTSWAKSDSGLPFSSFVSSLAACGTIIFAGIMLPVFPPADVVYSSSNSGRNWARADSGFLGSFTVSTFAVYGTNLFAGVSDHFHPPGGGVYVSSNNGTSWTAVNTGLQPKEAVLSLIVSGTSLFAGTNDGVWRRPLSEMVTGVEMSSTEVPEMFELEQNYPNPFNPSTTIKYELPRTSQVSLTVFDILGREVSVLVNDRRDAGVYEVKFDGSNLASGVYFYRIQAGDFTQTKRLLLLK
jgi:hypothetical protein